MKDIKEVELIPHVSKNVVSDITGFKLCSYLVALEGWRRGLTLKWYSDETGLCKMDRLNSSTHGKFYSLSSGSKEHFFFRSRGDKVSNKSVRICQNKEKTKDLLIKGNVPTTQGKIVDIDDEGVTSYAGDFGYPVVIKPLNGSMGKGVYTNIRDEVELLEAVNDFKSRYKYKEILLEKYYPGKEYRIYVVGDKVIGATNRIPANVQGDGVNSIEKLIENKNELRKTNPYLAPKPIKVDYEVKHMLKKAGYDLQSVPVKDETIYLREKSNLSSGGDPIEATDELSEEVKQIAVDSLKALPSIPHAGVDIIVNPEDNSKGVVLEINATAEIGFHLFPLEGKAKDVAGAVIDYYFPETVGGERSNFYFDYLSTLEPLKSWAVEELKITDTPLGQLYGKKYVVQGKVQQVGYMNWVRRQALRRGFFGSSAKLDKDKIVVSIFGKEKEALEKFKELCYKGSKKSKVDNIEEFDLELDQQKPMKVGFEINTGK